MTSRMGSVADNTSGASYGYRMSKAALNAAGKSLALDLKPKGIAVTILHPGFVKTGEKRHGLHPNGRNITPDERMDLLPSLSSHSSIDQPIKPHHHLNTTQTTHDRTTHGQT
jgi:NAD(P)-dependent dehydrogenase (short-subunit alcohol dehydrogenase family)